MVQTTVAPGSGRPTSERAATAAAAATHVQWAEAVLLLAVGVPVLFWGLGLSFLDPDEGLYADVARAMAVGWDFVVPRFNGLPYLEKPPLYFWLGAAALAAGIPAEWALRGWSALAALASALLAWRIGRRLYGPEAGVLAGLVLVTTVGWVLYVRKASVDFVFVAALTLALWGFLRDTEPGRAGAARFLFLYVGAALALLAKGLIGLVFPVLIVAVTLLVVRDLRVGDLGLGRGVAIVAVLALPWHVAVAWRDPGLLWFYLVDNQILRFLDRRGVVEDDVPMTTLGFLVVTFVWLFPWGVFALARPRAAAGTPAARWRPLLVIWAVVVIGFFALSRSKLEYYALPAFPALAVLIGAAWTSGRDVGRWVWVGLAGVAAVGGLVLWVGARLTPEQALRGLAHLNVYYRILLDQGQPFPFTSARPFGRLLQALGVVLVVGWGAVALCWARRWRRASLAMVTATAVAIAVLIIELLALIEPHHSAESVAQALGRWAGADDVIVHEGSLEYSAALPYYTGRRIVVVNGTRGDLELASRRPEARGFFLDTDGLRQLWGDRRRVFLVTQQPPGRGVVAALPAEAVYPLGGFGSRALYSNRPGGP